MPPTSDEIKRMREVYRFVASQAIRALESMQVDFSSFEHQTLTNSVILRHKREVFEYILSGSNPKELSASIKESLDSYVQLVPVLMKSFDGAGKYALKHAISGANTLLILYHSFQQQIARESEEPIFEDDLVIPAEPVRVKRVAGARKRKGESGPISDQILFEEDVQGV